MSPQFLFFEADGRLSLPGGPAEGERSIPDWDDGNFIDSLVEAARRTAEDARRRGCPGSVTTTRRDHRCRVYGYRLPAHAWGIQTKGTTWLSAEEAEARADELVEGYEADRRRGLAAPKASSGARGSPRRSAGPTSTPADILGADIRASGPETVEGERETGRRIRVRVPELTSAAASSRPGVGSAQGEDPWRGPRLHWPICSATPSWSSTRSAGLRWCRCWTRSGRPSPPSARSTSASCPPATAFDARWE